MTDFPKHFGSDFKEVWSDWIQHRKEIHHALKETTIKYQLRKLAKLTEAEAIATIERSIENGWQGLFPEKKETTDKPCLVCKSTIGTTYQPSNYGRTYLCAKCRAMLGSMGVSNWGKMPRHKLEKLVERGKVKTAVRSTPPEPTHEAVVNDQRNEAMAKFNEAKQKLMSRR